MRQHARALLAGHGDPRVPVRLGAFFEWAGIRRVRSEEMPLEGALRRLPDGRFDILVREDAAPARRRFSVAHELGHVLFYRHAPHAKAQQARHEVRAPAEEERLCNVAAEELLMPCHAVQRVCSETDGVDRVVRLAQECKVSIEAAMIRLAPLWRGRGEVQLWQYRGVWRSVLVRRLAHTSSSLATFDVEEWNGKVPERAALPWKATTGLYSRRKRLCLRAHTTAISIGRRTPTLLVSHELVKESTLPQVTELERVGRERVLRAQVARALRGCSTCGGTGWVDRDREIYDPANRLRPVQICPCRYDQSLSA